MAYLTAEEIEKAIGWWKREKAEAERLFRESLTHEQRELLKRRYRAERAMKTLRRWLQKAKEGKLRKRTLHVPAAARRDYAFLLMAKELRFPPSAAEALKEAFNHISDVDKIVLEVCYGFDLGRPRTLKEAAYRLGMPPTAVKLMREVALRRLKINVGKIHSRGSAPGGNVSGR
jgi:hypothetical protein